MSDLISRQAAMEMLMVQNVIMDGSEYHNGFNAGVNRAQEVIRNLPPVQPNHNAEVSKMVDDLISRQAAIYIASGYCHPANIAKELAKLPSAGPERMKGAWINEGRITRCNKCKIGYATVKGLKSALTYNFCPNCGADMRGKTDAVNN